MKYFQLADIHLDRGILGVLGKEYGLDYAVEFWEGFKHGEVRFV